MKSLYKITLLIIIFVNVSLALAINVKEKAYNFTDNFITKQQSKQADLNKINKEIDREIGKPRAKRLNQCRVIAFGAKACGGPKTYLVYSNLQTNENKLKRLVNKYNFLEEKINKENNIMSDCIFVGEPKVTLVSGMCRIKHN